MPEDINLVTTAGWINGVNSLLDPVKLPRTMVQWSVNQINRGGVYATRPGYTMLLDAGVRFAEPRGMTLFTPAHQDPILVKAVGTVIRISKFPFTSWTTLAGVTLDSFGGRVYFETAVKGARTLDDGSLETFESYPVLIIQTGLNAPWMWDGTRVTRPDTANGGTPIGTWMKWTGDRLWVATGKTLKASNLLSPDQFLNDGSTLVGAGYFTFNGDITGMIATPDEQTLLVFTDENTSSLQSSILNRDFWLQTPGFQRVILPNIGCVAGFTIVLQWGMIWWLSQGGLVRLDAALNSFVSSRINYLDAEMARSKSNLSDDLSRACAASYENFLVLSVPSGDLHNAHTWVLDQGILEGNSGQAPPAWASCWIGTAPVQWVSKVVRGKARCFQLSRGQFPAATDNSPVADVWETFCSDFRKDITYAIGGARSQKEISWSLEPGFLSDDSRFKIFDYVEIMLMMLSRVVNITASYASRHSGYKQVLSKQIVADVDTFHLTSMTAVNARLLQTRRVRSTADTSRLTDKDIGKGLEDIYTRNKDRGFFLLITGTGDATIEGITLSTVVSTDKLLGRVEENETTVRYIEPDGTIVITPSTAPPTPSMTVRPQSRTPRVADFRGTEIVYNSLP